MICDKAQIPLLTVFSRILMSMNKLSHDGKDKVITFLSSIAFIFVGNDKENFDYSTLKSAKKAIFKYVDDDLSPKLSVNSLYTFGSYLSFFSVVTINLTKLLSSVV